MQYFNTVKCTSEMSLEIQRVSQSEICLSSDASVQRLTSTMPDRPYLIDLDSANGTTVNDEKIPPSRYYELQPNDLIKFAYSTRECEHSSLAIFHYKHAELTCTSTDVLIVDWEVRWAVVPCINHFANIACHKRDLHSNYITTNSIAKCQTI